MEYKVRREANVSCIGHGISSKSAGWFLVSSRFGSDTIRSIRIHSRTPTVLGSIIAVLFREGLIAILTLHGRFFAHKQRTPGREEKKKALLFFKLDHDISIISSEVYFSLPMEFDLSESEAEPGALNLTKQATVARVYET